MQESLNSPPLPNGLLAALRPSRLRPAASRSPPSPNGLLAALRPSWLRLASSRQSLLEISASVGHCCASLKSRPSSLAAPASSPFSGLVYGVLGPPIGNSFCDALTLDSSIRDAGESFLASPGELSWFSSPRSTMLSNFVPSYSSLISRASFSSCMVSATESSFKKLCLFKLDSSWRSASGGGQSAAFLLSPPSSSSRPSAWLSLLNCNLSPGALLAAPENVSFSAASIPP
mmetsp:Transcript_42598/g.78747  ORF Transcript_42598/g.78747 Transcript_42598/m.78747 type:complete len:231 (-) Transcript_42598:1083-1775(-)